MKSPLQPHRGLLGIILALFLLPVVPLLAQQAEEGDEGGDTPSAREMRFIEDLLARGWADYAETAQGQFAKSFPGEAKKLTLLKARVLSAQGKFADAVALVAGLPATDPVAMAAQINMARNMYARGQKDEASKIFEKVFAEFKDKLPSDRALLEELGEAGYVYYQMKMDSKEFYAAAKALDFPIKALSKQIRKVPENLDPEDPKVLDLEDENKNIRLSMRLLEAKKGFALVDQAKAQAGKKEEQDKTLATAQKLAEKLSLVYDLAFGHSIVIMMQLEQVRGNLAGIDKLTKDYKDDLLQMDELIKKSGASMAESPLAGSRFIKGEMYLDKARKAGTKDEAVAAIKVAGNEFANVFVKYAGSVWEDKAAEKFNELKKFAKEKYDADINLPTKSAKPADVQKIVESGIRLGTEMLNQGKFKEAAEQFGRLLNQYPEFKGSGRHYGNLARAYQGLGDHRAVTAIAGYLAERLNRDEGALPALQILAKAYFDKIDDPEQRHIPIYEMIGDRFPTSPVAPSALYLVAETHFSKGNREKAMAGFDKIIERHPGTKEYVRASNRKAFFAYEEKNYEEAAKLFEVLSKNLPEGLDRAQAQYRLANCLRSLDRPDESVKMLNELTKALDPARKDSPFYAPESKAKSQELVEDVWYTLALGQIKGAESAAADKAADAQKAAAATLGRFLESYPKSKKAPDAMFQLGKMQIKIGKVDDAVKTFNDLATKYPASDEGKDALYSLAKAAVEAGKPEIAQDAVKKMLAQSGDYKAVQFLKVGRFMMENKFFVEAEAAMKVVLKHADTQARPELEQEALFNLADSSLAQGKFDAAVTASTETLKKFPNSGYLFRLYLVQAEALARLGKFDEATGALKIVYEQAHKFKQVIAGLRADMIAALIEELKNDSSKAAGAYMRIVMLGDHSKPDTAAVVKEAAFKGIENAKKATPPNWVAVREFADFYLEYFPGDEKAPQMRRARAEAITNGAPDTK